MPFPAEVWAIAERLQRSLAPESIHLFGSYARGDSGPDSDVDLLAVVAKSDQSRYQRSLAARCAVSDVRVPKDIIVMTHQEWEAELRVPSSLASTVLREGVVLHGS